MVHVFPFHSLLNVMKHIIAIGDYVTYRFAVLNQYLGIIKPDADPVRQAAAHSQFLQEIAKAIISHNPPPCLLISLYFLCSPSQDGKRLPAVELISCSVFLARLFT